MTSMSRLGLLLLALLLALPTPSTADPEQAARDAVEETVNQVLSLLNDEELNNGQRIERLTLIAEARFDLGRMSKLILGRNRRKLSAEQQEAFLEEWKRHLTATYGDSLEEYSGEQVEITSTRPERNGDVTVKTKIIGGAAGDGILVNYRMRAVDGEPWRVLDVFIEGVSVVQNFRAQVQEIVSSQGADRLIEVLREKNDRKQAEQATF
jgi:phospholipid transport system substrate-binding protein